MQFAEFQFFFSTFYYEKFTQITKSKNYKKYRKFIIQVQSISGRVDRASATETVDSGSIPSRIKPKTIKICIHSFPA